MKKLLLLFGLCFGLIALPILLDAQINLKDKLKNATKNRANQKTDQGINKGLDAVEDGVKDLFKKKKPDEQTQDSTSGVQDKETNQNQKPACSATQKNLLREFPLVRLVCWNRRELVSLRFYLRQLRRVLVKLWLRSVKTSANRFRQT